MHRTSLPTELQQHLRYLLEHFWERLALRRTGTHGAQSCGPLTEQFFIEELQSLPSAVKAQLIVLLSRDIAPAGIGVVRVQLQGAGEVQHVSV